MNKIKNLPYYVTLISLFLPLIATHFNIDVHRILLVITFFIFFIWLLNSNYKLRAFKYSIPFLIIFISLMIIDIIIGRGLRTFSHGHTFVYIIIFFHIYFLKQNEISAKMLFDQSDMIFKIIIFFLLIESTFLVTGNFNFLQELFPATGRSSVVEGFRSYHNRFAEYYNLGFPGLNSLITGNQVASNLALLSMVWFAPLYKHIHRNISRNIWFILSTLLLLFSPTMSAVGLLLIAMFILFFILSISNIRKLHVIIPMIIIIFLVGSWSIKFIILPLFTLLPGDHIGTPGAEILGIDWYWVGLTSPITNYLSMPLMDMLFGAQSVDYASRYFFNEIGIIRFAMIVGLPLITTVAVLVSITFIKSISLTKLINERKNILLNQLPEYQLYLFLSQVNILIVILWLCSTLHYLIIFRLGVVQLIAFQFTISAFSLYKSIKTIKTQN